MTMTMTMAMVMAMAMTGDDLLCRSVSPSAQAGCLPRSPCTEPATGFKDYGEYE